MKLHTFNKKAILAALLPLFLQPALAQEYFSRISMEGVELAGAITWGKIDEYTQMDPGFFDFPFERQFQPNKTNPLHPMYAAGGVVLHDGKIYSNEYDDSGQVQAQKPMWRIYDAATLKLLSEHQLKDNCESTTYSLAYDPVNQKIYGLLATFTETFFVEVDPENGNMKRVAELNRDYKFFALACNKRGVIYCTYLDKMGGGVYLAKIRKSDGKLAVINGIQATNFLPGDDFINSTYDQAMFFNNANDKLYWMFGSSSLYLYKEYTAITEVNTSNATTSLVAYLPELFLISGAFFVEPELKAPAIITDFQFLPQTIGSQQGKLQFKLPTTAYDGTALTTPLTVEVTENGKTLLEKTANPGETFISDVLEFTNETHTIQLVVSNDIGRGPAVKRSFFVGYDIPDVCQNIRLTADGLTTTLTWEPPVKGINGSPINTKNLTYKVIRYPYEVTVAESTDQRIFVEEHPANMTRYVYTVIPVDGTREGRSAFSNNLIVGTPLDVPYGGIFKDAADMINYYTIIDSNKDNRSWSYDINTSAAYYTFNEMKDADDWLIAPPINYKKGTEYNLRFKAYSWSPDYLESMEVRFGKERTAEAQNKLLLNLPEIPAANEDTPVQEYSVDFTVDEDGVYYYSFHATSPAFSGYLFVFDIHVVDKNQSSITTDAVEDTLQIKAADRQLCIANPTGKEIAVYTISGEKVILSKSEQIAIDLPQGIYIVATDHQTQKVVIF